MRNSISGLTKKICLAGSAAVAAGSLIAADDTNAKPPPNFIVIYMDDLGWADTSVRMMKDNPNSRSYFHQTPNLEKLAKDGVVFSNAYSPSPTCTPSRASIQFGKTNARLRITTVHDVVAKKKGVHVRNEVSLAQMLKQAKKGYKTAHFGKGIASEKMNTIGYDVTDELDICPNGNFHGEYNNIKERKPVPADDPKRIYSLTKSAVNFISDEAKKKEPFFMMLSAYAVHVPHAASPKMIEKYRKLKRGKYCNDRDYMDPAKMSKGYRTCAWRLQYAAMLEETDISLGRIMDAVKKAGIADNTYIIYTSDNGGGLGPNGNLKGGKADLFEGGIRIPTVITGPGVPKGKYCDVPIIQWDLLPTLHDLSGSKAPLPKDIDGGSWRDVMENCNKGKVKRPVKGMVFNYPYYAAAPVNAIRVGDYKFMRQLNTGDTLLYNVAKDYREKHNLSKSMPEKAAELDKIMQAYLKKVGATKIEEVYPTRLAEIDGFKKMTQKVYKQRLNEKLAKAPVDKHAAIKADMKKWLDREMKRHAKSIEHCEMQMENTKWIGGNYKKKSKSKKKK